MLSRGAYALSGKLLKKLKSLAIPFPTSIAQLVTGIFAMYYESVKANLPVQICVQSSSAARAGVYPCQHHSVG